MLCLNMFFCAVHVQEHHLTLGVEMPSEGTWHKNLTSHPKKTNTQKLLSEPPLPFGSFGVLLFLWEKEGLG